MLYLLMIPLFWVLLAVPVQAEPVSDARKELVRTEEEIKKSADRQKELAKETMSLEREMQLLQAEMIALAKTTGDKSEELAGYEEKQSILQGQREQRVIALDRHKKNFSELMVAMIRFRELPPEAVVMMPGKLDEVLKAAQALKIVAHAIEVETRNLKEQVILLDNLEKTIVQHHHLVEGKQADLNNQLKQLKVKLEERSKIQSKLGGQMQEEQARLKKLTSRSRTLQELVDSLEKAEQKEASFAKKGQTASKDKHNSALRPFANAKGKLQLPPGKLLAKFGNDSLGSIYSHGVVIRTHPNSQVVSLYDGEVVFAGAFRDYGTMVILRHKDGYHTLLAGLSNVNCVPGQFVMQGEPVGAMGDKGGQNQLYIELRNAEKPIDPTPWFQH